MQATQQAPPQALQIKLTRNSYIKPYKMQHQAAGNEQHHCRQHSTAHCRQEHLSLPAVPSCPVSVCASSTGCSRHKGCWALVTNTSSHNAICCRTSPHRSQQLTASTTALHSHHQLLPPATNAAQQSSLQSRPHPAFPAFLTSSDNSCSVCVHVKGGRNTHTRQRPAAVGGCCRSCCWCSRDAHKRAGRCSNLPFVCHLSGVSLTRWPPRPAPGPGWRASPPAP